MKHLERTTVTEFVVPDADYDTNASAGFWGRFLKKSPSPRFLEDLQRMNETELDEVKIQKIERKLDWLIIPALAICYAVSRHPIHRYGTLRPSSFTTLTRQRLHMQLFLG